MKYEVKSHSYPIADTGDFDGCWEITNGSVSLFTNDDGDDIKERLQEVCDLIDKTEITFYLDDSDRYVAESLKNENDRLLKLLEKNGINPYEYPDITDSDDLQAFIGL